MNFKLFKNIEEIKNKNLNLYFSNFFYKFFNKNLKHFKKIDLKKINCSFCKSDSIIKFIKTYTKPEHKVNFLSEEIFTKFYFRSIGQCSNCGLLQDYNKLSKNEYENYILEMKKKNNNYAPEDVFRSLPVPSEVIKNVFDRNYKKRFSIWKKFIPINNLNNIFLIRPYFGLLNKYFENNSNINIYFNDFSIINKEIIKKDHPNMKYLDGATHHIFEGDFLQKENFFDLITIDHTLCHSLDINDFLTKVKKILKNDGKIIFMNEIQMKLNNPFHLNFYDEQLFVKILEKFFKVKVIRNCGYNNNLFINNFTEQNDNPDFICTKK